MVELKSKSKTGRYELRRLFPFRLNPQPMWVQESTFSRTLPTKVLVAKLCSDGRDPSKELRDPDSNEVSRVKRVAHLQSPTTSSGRRSSGREQSK